MGRGRRRRETARPSRASFGAAARFPTAGPGRRARNGWTGLGGGGVEPTPAPRLLCPLNPRTVRRPQLQTRSALVSLLCVYFLLPSVCQPWGEEGAPSTQPPNPPRDPPLAATQRATHRPAAGPERGATETPAAPTARPGGVRRRPPAPLALPPCPAHLPAAPAGSG